jgi:DNA polymerase III epsilon subunit-like protein
MITVVFDTETTGLIINPARSLALQPEIISLAAQEFDLETGEQFSHYYGEFKTVKPVSEEITRITGLTNEHLSTCQSIEKELPIIINMLRSAPLLIGQNIRFDQDMVELECRRYKYPPITWPKTLDLVQNSIHLKGYRLNLTNLHIELFGTEFKDAHDARTDAMITAKCAVEMFRKGML